MNHNFYYDGRQIKNYLIGFASLFSEIPYQNRKGVLESVPIHYGSPSDIISHLEMNVDNEETHNRNRLKDIAIPLFSFRMTGLEANTERRRAPLNDVTVDLRPMGYSTGYVTMKPAPFKFTFELVLWASSDYQAFEITEQIIPYFNSPQQVVIEPLPRCSVSTTEVFLDSIEIDTDPSSQKCSAITTMTFTLTGWLLSQPRIWSTNMKFELSMLDKNDNNSAMLDNTDYSFGTEFIDNNTKKPKSKTTKELSFESVDKFIVNTELIHTFGRDLDLYNLVVQNNGISKENGQLLTNDSIEIEYKNETLIFTPKMIGVLIDSMEEMKYLYDNELLRNALKNQTLSDDFMIVQEMINDKTETIEIYLKLLEHNLITNGFNISDTRITNSEKLNIFGTFNIDIDQSLNRLRSYTASLENLKVKKEKIKSFDIISEDEIMLVNVLTDSFKVPDEFKIINGMEIKNNESNIKYIDIKYNKNDSIELIFESNLSLDHNINKLGLISLSNNVLKTEIIDDDQITFNKSNNNYNITLNNDFDNQLFSLINLENPQLNICGIVKIKTMDMSSTIVEFTDDINIDLMDIKQPQTFKIHNTLLPLDLKFTEMDELLIATMIVSKYIPLIDYSDYNVIDIPKILKSKPIQTFLKRFNKTTDDLITYHHSLNKLLYKITPYVSSISIIDGDILKTNQQINSGDIASTIQKDNDGKIIYDINEDGFIDSVDLELLDANVDNIDSYNFKDENGIWVRLNNLSDIVPERLMRISTDLKIIYFLSEKDNLDELKLYLILWGDGLLTDGFDIPKEKEKKDKLIQKGYNISDLDNQLLFFRLFVSAVKNIMINEREYILYNVPDMNEESKLLLTHTEGLNIDRMVMSKFLDRYFLLLNDEDQIVLDQQLFRKILPNPMGEYYADAYNFNLFWSDIKKTEFLKERLKVNTPWLEQKLPEVVEKINKIN